MVLTQDKPTQNGDYWFRRGKNKLPQIVRVQDGKVIFPSKKAKDISAVDGEWGGAVTSPGVPRDSRSESSTRADRWFSIGKPILLLLIGAIVGALLNEPYFTYVGDEKQPEIEQDLQGTPHRISFKVFPIFKNWGLKRGHIEDVKFTYRELALYPDAVILNYCDRAPISITSIFSGKTIICNFVATIDPKRLVKDQKITFQVSYYGPGGHEIHTESYRAIPQFK